MLKKIIFPVICTIIAIIAIISMINISPNDAPIPVPQAVGPSTQSAEQVPSSYEIKLSEGKICLFTLDGQGSEIERKTLGYIDIHSLQAFQLDKILAGAKFESREAAAQFIQDLDS